MFPLKRKTNLKEQVSLGEDEGERARDRLCTQNLQHHLGSFTAHALRISKNFKGKGAIYYNL